MAFAEGSNPWNIGKPSLVCTCFFFFFFSVLFGGRCPWGCVFVESRRDQPLWAPLWRWRYSQAEASSEPAGRGQLGVGRVLKRGRDPQSGSCVPMVSL